MPRFEPFPALRYRPGEPAEAVTAPPYDVLSEADVDLLAGRDPHNIVHVDVPRGPDCYARAAQRLAAWLDEGVLVRDPAPGFTLYRMRFVDESGRERATVGVIGALEVVDDGAGGVLPHERTTKKASTDRLDLTRATACNLSPVWGLSLASGLTELLREPGELLAELEVNGVWHGVERVTDPERLRAISALVGTADVLIADGHHRYGVARQYRDERRDAAGSGVGGAGSAETTLAYLAELTAEQLTIQAIHRVYSDVDPGALRAALEVYFELLPAPEPGEDTLAVMAEQGRLVLLIGARAWWLVPRSGAFDDVRELDGAWLEHALAELPHSVDYQHGLTEVRARLEAGDGTVAAVLIRPTSLEEIARTAHQGVLMPPKSTFFTPKLRTGFVMREMP